MSDKDKLSISSAISGRRISAEVVSPSRSCRSVFVLAEPIKWLEKPPDPSAMQTHEPKTKVFPASIAGKPKSKETIEFFCRLLARCPTVGASCRCFTGGFSEGYPEESGYEQGLAEIRMRWCKEHKDLDRFMPPERNTLRPV